MNILKIWRNRKKILEGWFNKHIRFWKKTDIDKIAAERLRICRTNKCGYYDPFGQSPNTIVKGHESCGGCGCKFPEKQYSLSSYCYLKDIGKTPLWDAN